MSPSLSVILPSYNHGRYVGEALEAICAQSLAPKEVVVVEDGSTDDSAAVVEGFARRYPFVRLLRNDRNRGAAYSANRGLSEITGDYFVCCSADDKVMPGFFEKTMAMLAKHPEAGLCSALGRWLGPDGEDLGPYETPLVSPAPGFIPPARVVELFREHGSWWVSHTVVFKREAVLSYGGWDPELLSTSDGVLTFLIAGTRGACFIPERLAYWRRLPDSLSSRAAPTAERLLGLLDKMAAAMRAPKTGAPGLPEAFFEEWWRRSLLVGLYELSSRGASAADLRAVMERLPRGLSVRAGLVALDRPALAAAAVKLVLFAHEPFRVKAAQLARRLARAAGAGA